MGKELEKKGKYSSPDGSATVEYCTAFITSLQAFSLGYMMGWFSPSIIMLGAPESPIKITIEGISNIAAALAVGQGFAPLVSGVVLDKIGRKNSLIFAGLPLIISWAMIYCAKDIWVVIVARVLAGFAFGACFCTGPLYLGEIASIQRRGLLGSVGGAFLNSGVLFAFIIVPILSVQNTALVFLIISIIVEIGICFIPESPYFLIMVGRDDAAEASLEKLRGRTDVSEEFSQIKSSIINDSTKKIGTIRGLKKLFKLKKNLRAFFITTVFVLPQQIGGFAQILFFSHVIFRDAGGNILSQDSSSIIVGITQVLSSILTAFVVDRVGRKVLIFWSGLVATICNITIAGYFFMIERMNIEMSNYSIIPLIAAMLLVFSFNIGLTSVQMILLSEVYATDVKAIGTCLTAIISGIFSIISQKMYLLVVDTWELGHCAPFTGFTIVTLLSTLSLLYATPETKGKTFAEIQQLLAN